MNTFANTYNPDYAVHPGEYLEEVLTAREIKPHDFIQRMGITKADLSRLIKKKEQVTPELALKLERVLGVSSQIWNNMNARYHLFEARQKEKQRFAEKKEAWAKDFPLTWLKKHRHIPNTRQSEVLMDALLSFFEVSSSDTWEQYYKKQLKIHLKTDTSANVNVLKTSAAWLRAAEVLAAEMDTKEYKKDAFEKKLKDIQRLTHKSPDEAENDIRKHCADAGVAFVRVPPPPELHVHTATKWVTPHKVMFVISFKQKTTNKFWRSFFHGAGHIVLHNKKDIFIDGRDMQASKQKNEAEKFSQKFLAPA